MLSCNQNTAPLSAPATLGFASVGAALVAYALASCVELLRRGEHGHAAQALEFAIDTVPAIGCLETAARALVLTEALGLVGQVSEVRS